MGFMNENPDELKSISREAILTETINISSKELKSHIVNRTAVKEIVLTYFNRTSPDLYPIIDAFTYVILDAICRQIQSNGIKQPKAADFINAYKSTAVFNINIGTLKVDKFVITDEMKKEMCGEIIKHLKNSSELYDGNDDFDIDLKKYENFREDNVKNKEDNGSDDYDGIN